MKVYSMEATLDLIAKVKEKISYRQYAEQLVKDGHAYYAFDTTEELEKMRIMISNQKQILRLNMIIASG